MRLVNQNDAFFVPTIMMYIVVFLIILLFIVLQTISLEINTKGYENNLYKEVSYLDSQKMIKDYLGDLGTRYSKVCKDDNIEKSTDYYTIKISLKCRRFFDFSKVHLEKVHDKRIKLELSKDEYAELQKQLTMTNRDHMTITHILYRIGELFFIEAAEDLEAIKKELNKYLEDQIIFDVNVKIDGREYSYMEFYEFEKKKVGLRIHT